MNETPHVGVIRVGTICTGKGFLALASYTYSEQLDKETEHFREYLITSHCQRNWIKSE